MSMKTSPDGISLIKHFEGLRLAAYPDPATKGDPWTIGVGHTGKEVHSGLVWTEAQCDEALAKDLEKFETGVNRVAYRKPSQCEFDALVSFAFNCGLGNLQSSTLLKKFNLGEIGMAADEFLRWNKAAGKEMAGLTKRRGAERALFLGINWRETTK